MICPFEKDTSSFGRSVSKKFKTLPALCHILVPSSIPRDSISAKISLFVFGPHPSPLLPCPASITADSLRGGLSVAGDFKAGFGLFREEIFNSKDVVLSGIFNFNAASNIDPFTVSLAALLFAVMSSLRGCLF